MCICAFLHWGLFPLYNLLFNVSVSLLIQCASECFPCASFLGLLVGRCPAQEVAASAAVGGGFAGTPGELCTAHAIQRSPCKQNKKGFLPRPETGRRARRAWGTGILPIFYSITKKSGCLASTAYLLRVRHRVNGGGGRLVLVAVLHLHSPLCTVFSLSLSFFCFRLS